MGIPLRRGTKLTDADGQGSEKVLLISESMAQQSFAGVDPIGKQIMCGWDSSGEWMDDCGRGGRCAAGFAGCLPAPTIYMPVAQHPYSATQMQVVVQNACRYGCDGC